ncbi:GxxExxY protein, partial [bacterium]|nr:GxxExxY protein [bacterium]
RSKRGLESSKCFQPPLYPLLHKEGSLVDRRFSKLIQKIIGLAIEVHKNLGPGYIESIYEKAMCYEMDKAEISYLRQIEILVPYKDINLPGQRLDLLIEKQLIVDLKAVDQITSIHQAQILSYMKSQKVRAGLTINFKVQQLRLGIRRFVIQIVTSCYFVTFVVNIKALKLVGFLTFGLQHSPAI